MAAGVARTLDAHEVGAHLARADVERLLREAALAWYGAGVHDTLATVRAASITKDNGRLN